jgi:prepilin-type N-terminal cleavage/methylation domain-containing protein
VQPKGFTIIELLIVIAVFGVLTAAMSTPLSTLLAQSAVKDSVLTVKNGLRRAATQAMVGHQGDSWGIHLSDSDGCALPAKKIHIFRGAAFTSATDTIETIDLPAGASITALSIGGGCDVTFSRYEGLTASAGVVTVTGTDSSTGTVTINAYGRVTAP